MKNLKKSLFFNNLFVFANKSFAKIESMIVLKIENEIISNYEVKNKILTSLIMNGQEINQKNIDNYKKTSIRVIDTFFKLKKIELSKYNFENNPKQVNDYLNLISSNNIEKLKEKFKGNNLDYDIFLEEIETQFKWQKLIYKIYSNQIDIDETSIDLKVREITENQKKIGQLRLSEIEVMSNNDESDKEKVLEIISSIKNEGFEKSAMKYSISLTSEKKGDLGWIESKSLSPKIYSCNFKMKLEK